MVSIKEIIWIEQNVDILDYYIYYDGILNGHQVVTINTQYDSDNIPTGYIIYVHIDNSAESDRTEYETLDEAKLVAKKKVEDFIFGLIDMRDYKINELLNKKED
jgi:hypothetical protein